MDVEHPEAAEPEVEAPSKTAKVVAGIVIAVALVIGALLYTKTQVCDQQVTDAGSIIEACRTPQSTDPHMILVAAVIVVALSAFFSEISGWGFGLKRAARRAERKADAASRQAVVAKNVAESALQTSHVAEQATLDRGATTMKDSHGNVDLRGIEDLVAEFNDVRTQTRGAARVSKETSVVSRMISALNGASPEILDIHHYLTGDDGQRLAAYAFIYANPEIASAPQLVRAILGERANFSQYWAIRALRRIVTVDPAALDLNSHRELASLLSKLGKGTDRAYELRQVLAIAEYKNE